MAGKGTRGSQDVTATADEKLQRHLRALGLESADAYRAWCRRHGFGDSLRKSWQEQRQERLAAQKAAAAETVGAEARRHLEALGLKTVEEYQAWSRAHGFSPALNKTRQQRQQEQRLAERLRSQAVLSAARRHTRRPQETLEAIYRGEIGPEELKNPLFVRVQERFAAEACPRVREAFLRLLLLTENHADLLDLSPAIAMLGTEPGNNYLDALHALARHEASWLRSLEEWRPDSHNRRRQFGSLARHLLARYPVPAFMDAAWFRGDGPEARRQQEWFNHIGIGQNIRIADIPLSLTKKMAHHFLEAPVEYDIEAALRWGQIHGLGGDEPLVRAVVGTRLGEMFEHEEFWVTVLQWFVNHPMLDTACVGPIIDYVHHQKFVPQAVVAEDGTARPGEPAQPEFSMKGRSATVLLAQVEAWHDQLAREARKPSDRWEPSGIGGFRLIEGDATSGNVLCWTVDELLTSQELTAEGKALNHCVRSYARSCVKGAISVWSLQVEDTQLTSRRHVMTIAVQNKGRVINQARGKANALPGSQKGGTRLRQGQAVMRQWAAAEGLTFARHL
jgi:hypothetical protein